MKEIDQDNLDTSIALGDAVCNELGICCERRGQVIFQIYKKADEKIGRLLKMFGDDTTFIVMSDHGAGPLYRPFFIQKWMASKGYLDVAGAGDGVVSKKRANRLLRNFVLLMFLWLT